MAAAMLWSCGTNEMTPETEPESARSSLASQASVNPGRIILHVSDEVSGQLEKAADEDGNIDAASVPSFAAAGITSLRRLFPEAGKFEARTRAEGLHKWYVGSFDELVPVTKAGDAVAAIPGVDEIEYDYAISITGGAGTAVYADEPAPSRRAETSSSSSLPFDDPRLFKQWHYFNDGSASGSVSGCDINVVPVWKNYTTGNPDVIVAVVDGGVDYTHEDLAANMWHNPDKSGNFQYGFNFVTNNYKVTADSHGTHVAGTIAAVNNNGVGVCGIAGGDAANGKEGVKIMSCQIFEGDNTGSGVEAIKWAADHGAVIAQNSWGYDEVSSTPKTLQLAVDYFIKYAGLDEDGNQTGPMAGGIVIFAAGNENTSVSSTSYDAIFNVASVGADYKRAYYSNYGEWVDIAAPGGDSQKGNMVLSTLPGDRYGYLQGTSMACPHVSGIAALLVSHNGKQGYTCEALEKSLRDGVTDISSFNGRFLLGSGLANAYKAIAGSGGTAPGTPSGLSVSAQSNNLNFSVKVPSDADDKIPSAIYVYYGKADFSSTSDVMFGMFYVDSSSKPGDVLEGTLSGLEFNTEYYVAAVACDLAGNMSGLSDRVRVTTGANSAPVVKAQGETVFSIKAHETAAAKFSITEPDGHYYSLKFAPGSDAAVIDTTSRENPVVRITGAAAPAGSYRATLDVTDYYGALTSVNVDYTILENHKPVTKGEIGNQIFNSKATGSRSFDIADYFYDEDGETLKYSMTISDPTVVNLASSDGTFILTPMNYGYADITVKGTDIRGESVSQSFKVLVRDGSREADVYPNPVKDNLFIRTGEETEAGIKVVGSSGAVVYDKTVAISPFAPATVDMSGVSAGSYTVILKKDGKETKYNVVKL